VKEDKGNQKSKDKSQKSKLPHSPFEEERISIIIPTINEAGTIQQTLISTQTGLNVEVIVADGGSQDDTVAIASAWGAKVLSVPKGRAKQMNLGAAAATGGILLFLHADTRLPLEFDAMVRAALLQPRATRELLVYKLIRL
jgi:glycosyltransferase involved in cell wall biosynthesis